MAYIKVALITLVFVATAVATVYGDANFDSSFGLTVTGPPNVNLADSFDIAVVSPPSDSSPTPIVIGAAGAFLTPPTSDLSVVPFSLTLDAGARGFARRPGGHAEAESAGSSYTVSFTNRLITEFQNLTFGVVGHGLLLAFADPGDSADASFGVSVFLSKPDGTLLANGKGDGVFAPPSTSVLEPFSFEVQTGPIARGGSFNILIRGFAGGSATAGALPEPSILFLAGIGLVGLACFTRFRACRRRRRAA